MLTGWELLTPIIATRVRIITSTGRHQSFRTGLYLLWSAPLPKYPRAGGYMIRLRLKPYSR